MLLWLDLETPGLDPIEDYILEVAWTFTDNHLRGVGHSLHSVVITPTPAAWRSIEESPFIQDMHGKSGLLDDLSKKSTRGLSWTEDRILEQIDLYVAPDEQIHLAGESVHFDLGFIRHWMPRLAERLMHRIYDTRTLKTFFESLGIEHGVVNETPHRAASDVAEVLAIARMYWAKMNELLTGGAH